MNLPLEPSEEPRSLIEAIRKRPALFMGCKSLRSLRDFMGGYLMALSQHRIEGDTNFSFVPRDFHDWIAYRTHFKESTSGWCNMIIATSGSEEEAFDRFFELAEEHAAREPKVVAVLKDKGGYYDRGDGPTAFPARIPLVVYTDDPGFFAETTPGDERFYPYLDWLDDEPELENYEILDEERFMGIFSNLWDRPEPHAE